MSNANNTFKNLASILEGTYGVGPLAATPTTIIWAADLLMARDGAESAYRELSSLNRKRERFGVIPAYPEYGTPLFGAWMKSSKAMSA